MLFDDVNMSFFTKELTNTVSLDFGKDVPFTRNQNEVVVFEVQNTNMFSLLRISSLLNEV